MEEELGKQIRVTQSARGWDVQVFWPENPDPEICAPMTSYPNAARAGARVLQLMEIAIPVTPQNWPERIGIILPDPEGEQ